MLDKDVLGTAWYSRRQMYVNKNIDDIIAEYGSMDELRRQMAIADAEEDVNHYKNNAVVNPSGTMIAPQNVGPVTGTGKLQ